MKQFISYTVRDGIISKATLINIEIYYKSFGEVYIDLLHNTSRYPQLRVIKELLMSDVVVLISTPFVHRSPWVRFEMLIARLFRKRIKVIEYLGT
jgi:hypothetical protein